MKTKSKWVDYKDLKSKVNVSDVLRHFGINVPIEKGSQIYLPCPLPGHAGDGDNPKAFSANTEKNAWRCLTHCGSGNVIDLFCKLSGRPFRQRSLPFVRSAHDGDILRREFDSR